MPALLLRAVSTHCSLTGPTASRLLIPVIACCGFGRAVFHRAGSSDIWCCNALQAKMANFSTKGTKTIMVLSNVTAQTVSPCRSLSTFLEMHVCGLCFMNAQCLQLANCLAVIAQTETIRCMHVQIFFADKPERYAGTIGTGEQHFKPEKPCK